MQFVLRLTVIKFTYKCYSVYNEAQKYSLRFVV